MRNEDLRGDKPAAQLPAADEALTFLALLYASGELEAEEAQAFERRLAEDQAARDALVQAVGLCLPLLGQGPARPAPAYRARVRRLLGRRSWRGQPALWGVLGMVAGILLMLLVGRPAGDGQDRGVTSPARQAPPATQREADEPEAAPTMTIATYWAELNNSKHLEKAHDEEARRKVRLVRNDERRLRPLERRPPNHP